MTALPAGIRAGMTGARSIRVARYRVAEISVVAWPIMDGLSGSRYGNFGQ
jgi:hypothetical protein